MSTPLSGLLASQLQPAEKKKVDAVVCEACQRVHLYSTSDWITLHGAWATGKPPAKSSRLAHRL